MNWRSSQYDGLNVTGPVHTQLGGGNIYNPSSGTDLTLGVALVVSDKITALVGTARGQSKDTGGNDVDGTWGDWTLQEGEHKIYMINIEGIAIYFMNSRWLVKHLPGE